MEGFMWRYHPATDRVVSLVQEGAIGRLRIVRAAFGFPLDPAADNVRWKSELEGGALMDVGCYCLSALRLLAGEPERFAAEMVEGGDGVDARMAGLLRFPHDVLGTFDCGMDVPRRAGLEVVGETATIVSLDPWHGKEPIVRILRPEAEPEDVPVEAADPYAAELDDLARAVREGGAPRLGRADAVGQARAIEALYRAARETGA
jgi:predicted dehydrogenase